MVAALLSPVSGVFFILGLAGTIVRDRGRRGTSMLAMASAAFVLITIGAYFGVPGPEGFPIDEGALVEMTLIALLLARPAAPIKNVLVMSIVLCPALVLIPNGMGSNFERFTWICLPVAVAATARAKIQIVATVTAIALGCTVAQTMFDLRVAANPISQVSYYRPLTAELDRLRGLTNYRVEVVPDGTHVAAFALLNHCLLARGYETQTDNSLNEVVNSPTLDVTSFRSWLDNNSVGIVAIDNTTLKTSPEYHLIRTAKPSYLNLFWSTPHWKMYRVAAPRPIASWPGRVVAAGQASMTIRSYQSGTIPVRIRWSHFLRVSGPPDTGHAVLYADGKGWTKLTTYKPGAYIITG